MFIHIIAHSDIPFDEVKKYAEADAFALLNDDSSKTVYWGIGVDEGALRRALGRLIGVYLSDQDELSSLLSNASLSLPRDERG